MGDTVELRLEVGEMSDDDIDTIEGELSCYIDHDYTEPEVESFDFGGISCGKQVSYDRYFDETYEYKDGILVVSTGFKYSYWLADGWGNYDMFDDENTYDSIIDEYEADDSIEDEEEYCSCGWSLEEEY